MKRLCFVLTAMNIGGTEKALLNLIDTLSPEEYDVTILLMHKTGGFLDEVPKWVQVKEVVAYPHIDYQISTSPAQLMKQKLMAFHWVKAFKIAWHHLLFRLSNDRSRYYQYVLRNYHVDDEYDTAVAFEGPADLITTFVLSCIKAKEKIQWIHFDVSKYLFHVRTARRLYPQYDAIHVVSDEARDALIGLVPQVADKTKTVRNVVSEKRCREMAEKGTGFTDSFSGIRILTVGRLSEEKGQDIIPEIAASLKKQGIKFCWYILGEGSWRYRIEEEIDKFDVSENVKLLGAKTNPYPFFKEADLYVQTSIHEGFCITLAEAKVFNLKIVSTECLGAHEQLDGYHNSRIVERNQRTIANVIFELTRENQKDD